MDRVTFHHLTKGDNLVFQGKKVFHRTIRYCREIFLLIHNKEWTQIQEQQSIVCINGKSVVMRFLIAGKLFELRQNKTIKVPCERCTDSDQPGRPPSLIRVFLKDQVTSMLTAKTHVRLGQGRESRDLFWLFCTCIQTEGVRKLFITYLILNEFSYGKMQIPCLHKQQFNIKVTYVMRCIFLHNLEQRLKVFARGCVEKYSAHSNSS